MKYVILASVLFLAACKENGSDQTDDMITICLDGVSYWFDGLSQSQMMAPRIDPETLTYVRCKGTK